MAPAIVVENLSRSYRSGQGELTVFSGLNLRIEAGEEVAVIGASGSGKSTLLHLLGGLDRPSAGRVIYGEFDLFAQSDGEIADFRNKRLGFVWQQNSLLPEFTAEENVAMPLLIRGVKRTEAKERAREGLKEVGLAERTHHRAGEMSGGEQQRTALARALVTEPQVLLADEPTGNLDHDTAASVMDLLAAVRERRGLTSVMVTHNIQFAESCPHVIRLEKGTVTEGPGAASSWTGR